MIKIKRDWEQYLTKKRAFDIVSKFIYDSTMEVERKFKCQVAVNYLYDDEE